MLEVATLSRPAPPGARAGLARGTCRAAEKGMEEIRKRIVAKRLAHFVGAHRAEPARSAAAEMHVPAALRSAAAEAGTAGGSRLLVHPPIRSELVVFLPLGWIAQDLVGFVDLFELRFRSLVARIHVGMMLARELAERLLDLFVGGGFHHAKRRVIVFEVHRSVEAEHPTQFIQLRSQGAPRIWRRE